MKKMTQVPIIENFDHAKGVIGWVTIDAEQLAKYGSLGSIVLAPGYALNQLEEQPSDTAEKSTLLEFSVIPTRNVKRD